MAMPKNCQNVLFQNKYCLDDMYKYDAAMRLETADDLLRMVERFTTQALKQLSSGHTEANKLVKQALNLQNALHEAGNALNVLRLAVGKSIDDHS